MGSRGDPTKCPSYHVKGPEQVRSPHGVAPFELPDPHRDSPRMAVEPFGRHDNRVTDCATTPN